MRVTIALILLILILCFGIYEQFFIKDVFEELKIRTEDINEIIKVEENKEKAIEVTEKTILWWEEKLKILEMMAPHVSVKEVSTELSTVKGQLINDDLEEASVSCYIIAGFCDSAPHLLGFKIEHIF